MEDDANPTPEETTVKQTVARWGMAEILTMVGLGGGLLGWTAINAAEVGRLQEKVASLQKESAEAMMAREALRVVMDRGRSEASAEIRDLRTSNSSEFRDIKASLASISSAVARLEGRADAEDREHKNGIPR